MPTKEDLEKLVKVLEKKIQLQEKELEKIDKNANRNFLYQTIVGFSLIGLSRVIIDSKVIGGGYSFNLLVFGGLFMLCIQGIIKVLRIWKGVKK